MALTAKQQQFLNNYVRKHSLKGKAKAKRAESFSEVRQKVMELLKSQPWLLPEVPAYRTRLDSADALGEALKFDRATDAMSQLLADMQQAVSAHPTGGDPSLAQPGNLILRTQLKSDRDDIVNAADWNTLLTGPISGDLKVLRGRLASLLDRPAPTAAQLIEARGLLDELRVKVEFVRKRKLEIDKRRMQLNKYAVALQGPNNAYPNPQIQALAQRALTLGAKDGATWTRADENAATALYLDIVLQISERDQMEHKNFKAGSAEGEIVLAVRRKYKTDNQGQVDKDQANFKLVVKPLTKEIAVDGFVAGGGASREMMGSVIGDKLQEMLGIDLNVAKTRLVKLDPQQLGLQPGAQVTASVQAFITDGESVQDMAIRALNLKGVATPKTYEQTDEALIYINQHVAKEEIQSKAVFDLIALHADRHVGNFILNADNKLVPIDHGNILPTRDGLRARAANLGPDVAFLGATDAAKEKLSPELIERVEKLNIDELVASMKAAHEELTRETPDANVGNLEEGINNARRSAEFMKFAARQLTVEQIYKAYSEYFEDIFFTEEDDKLQGFARAVAAYMPSDATRATLDIRYGDLKQVANRKELAAGLGRLGWPNVDATALVPNMLARYPTRLLEIIDRQIKGPALRRVAPLPPKPTGGAAIKDEHWALYHGLGGDAAAQRQSLGAKVDATERTKILLLRLVATGKLP